MATPQLSPGVLIREVDLTVGRADNVLDNIGAIAGPFPIGPVEQPVDIFTEADLLKVFGKPLSKDAQYEYWMTASSYLSYGGILKVSRVSNENLRNANVATDGDGVGDSSLMIKNFDDYEMNYADDVAEYIFAAKNPGTWANGLQIAFIDDKADQIIKVNDPSIGIGETVVGAAVTVSVSNVRVSSGSTSLFTGEVKGIVTGVSSDTSAAYLDVKITHLVNSAGVEEPLEYAQKQRLSSFFDGDTISIAGFGTTVAADTKDWYNDQTIDLVNSGSIYWSSLAPKPGTSQWATERNAKGDEINIAIFDDLGTVTGIKGSLLEKHTGLSKASDAVSAVNAPQKIWWKAYLAQNSNFIYVGDNPSDEGNNAVVYATGFEPGTDNALDEADEQWNIPAQDRTFTAFGNHLFSLAGGNDYGEEDGSMSVEVGDVISAYSLFSNRDEFAVDYLIQGPGGNIYEAQAKAGYLISLANLRKDCIAVISPHREIVELTNSAQQTDKIIEFFSSLPSSSYAVFDSGYKYTYDRFNNKFRYIPCNGDVAGLMVRTSINAYPWFSPAGQQRGILNNAIKLAYNPSKAQRDLLYPLRINAIVNQPGIGILLFGDKTALGYASAFDRINVRRLFLTVEQALEKTAQAQLFELNDELTRANFVNIVEPYLRDVRAKRGVYDFLVVCDESNNTPDVIDNNEFRADIYLKPAKSINYVTLTFVATRTGVSFDEVAGRV